MGSLRQHGLSYYRPAGNRVMVSGLLADPRVPACVITAQIAYWLRRRLPSRVRHGVWAAARPAIEREIEAGERWAEKSWSRHWQRNHPLMASR
jgi:hypothetical protein